MSDMERDTVINKTAEGERVIRERSADLDRPLRNVLILVDGRTSLGELLEKGAVLGEVEEKLEKLQELGLVAVNGLSEPPAADATGGQDDLAALKEKLIAAARDVLGADADRIVAKLQAAPDTHAGIVEVTQNCKKVIRLIIDEEKAERLEQRCQAILSQV